MPDNFDLIVSAVDHSAGFRLLDSTGTQIAYRHCDFTKISVSRQRGLFDLREFLRHYVETNNEAAAVAQIGVCIAEEVLGAEIFEKLWRSQTQRTLRIQLPDAAAQEIPFAAALARVPWEIARPSPDQPTLAQRNLIVRVVEDMQAPPLQPQAPVQDEVLRVLFVFTEAHGINPLGARRERQELMRLFEQEIYPQRRVVAHFLSHGVTRERLDEQIRQNSGYHVVHWSGHGDKNLLELAKPGGESDHILARELLALFTTAGGFTPKLFFFSAHSGDILRVRDWNDFLAVAQGREQGAKDAENPELAQQSGYTGTAHALLQDGVPSIVAMRYAVSDDYARELAVEFYRALLAYPQPKSIATVLNLARQSLNDGGFAACDHAAPLLYGAEQHGLAPINGVSPEHSPHSPRLHQIAELAATVNEHFVGRTWELAGLGADFIGAGRSLQPVAVITGLCGIGKTALCAEALALWERRFEWVLLYQAKPDALSFDNTLRDIHMKLNAEPGCYHDHVKAHPADAIHRDLSSGFTGTARLERLTRNLVRALKMAPILLVLDNFETNLESQPKDGQTTWSCQDPAWDRCLAVLAQELIGSLSRVLITCRRPLAALEGVAHTVPLGTLPVVEAALYLREHLNLNKTAFSTDAVEQALAHRLLNASRFHPLLMDRLSRLAADAKLRPELMQALDALEATKDFAELPKLFAIEPGDAREAAYLEDALAISLDQLIRDTEPEARRLLWMIAVANEPVGLELLKGVWSGENDPQQTQLREIKRMLERLPQLPAEIQKQLKELLTPEYRKLLDVPQPKGSARPDITPLLHRLVSVGLVTRIGSADDGFTCHELVRERIRTWMKHHQQDNYELKNVVRLAYAERLEAEFNARLHKNMSTALQAGSRALVYYVQAGAWDRLGGFAGDVVTGSSDPRLLAGLIPHLQSAADTAPEGEPRWRCLSHLADTLSQGGHPEAALPFYEQAADQARAVAEGGGETTLQAWSDLAWITGNQAIALKNAGDFGAAQQKRLDSAEAHKNAGHPAINVISSELEALRIDILQGEIKAALPEIELRLEKIEAWWNQHCSGLPVPEATDAEALARTFIGALDIAKNIHFAQQSWAPALRRIDSILEVKLAMERPAENIAVTRLNRANILINLNRFAEAQTELETCLPLFQNDPTHAAKTLSALADLFYEQGDFPQAIAEERRALALRENLPDPSGRAISHGNLAVYLKRGFPSDPTESSRHQLASLIYRLIAELGLLLQTTLHNYATDFRNADTEPTIPRVTELLADPAFDPLKQWLNQRQMDITELQSTVDQFLQQARLVAG